MRTGPECIPADCGVTDQTRSALRRVILDNHVDPAVVHNRVACAVVNQEGVHRYGYSTNDLYSRVSYPVKHCVLRVATVGIKRLCHAARATPTIISIGTACRSTMLIRLDCGSRSFRSIDGSWY